MGSERWREEVGGEGKEVGRVKELKGKYGNRAFVSGKETNRWESREQEG